ncbi:anticodon-binding protein [Nonomuraea africana]|uniref:Arginyl-tRNA synthetase n=1 Tax=Nonomuraea africana TaxID=46171 RepID=A0ABR9KWS6_9ACTN|nr:anticodon-binding protein [Nonomuraea africana]MBE1566201.1 arginyl-tRNA synthetase [Nonomuraea africana]
MRPGRLAEVLGEPPTPEGTWEREAVYLSAAALRRRIAPEELAAVLRDLEGVETVEVRGNGFLRITVDTPGELLDDPHTPVDVEDPWPDLPRTWDNPGFVVKYAHARAAAVLRWARELGVPRDGFAPSVLTDPRDRAVLRLLAELPGRRMGRDPGWAAYLPRLALAYHDAHEGAPAVPKGDEEPDPVHTARVRLAEVVLVVLPGPERI